jgi:ADP-ribose pyrophosphatase YjhB (NUDIX family)
VRVVRRRYRTARCILFREDEYLLAVHSSFRYQQKVRWGLPGGQIEWGEAPDSAVRRELREELSLAVPELVPVGPYPYKRSQHMVYAAPVDEPIRRWDDTELLDVRWFNMDQVRSLKDDAALHADYELEAIAALEQLLGR